MKCPYCGIHYMDDERQCPVCGKRPGFVAGKKEKHADFTGIYEPKSKPSRSTGRQQTYGNAPGNATAEELWARAARGEHTHEAPIEPAKHHGIGCFVAIIVFIVVSMLTVGLFRAFDSVSDNLFSATFDWLDDDDVYQDADIPDKLNGMWTNGDATFRLTIQDGTVSWETENGSYTDNAPSIFYMDLDEDTAEDYLTEEELEKYPPASYEYYNLVCLDGEDDDGYIDLELFLPRDTDEPDTIVCYDYNTYEYVTLTRVKDDAGLSSEALRTE